VFARRLECFVLDHHAIAFVQLQERCVDAVEPAVVEQRLGESVLKSVVVVQ
jgi:hypothetical protein